MTEQRNPLSGNPLAASASLVAEGLGKPVKLGIKSLHVSDQWAFVYGDLREPSGTPIDYRGTRFAEAAANGGKSRKYAVLLHNEADGWSRVDLAIGPTGLAWQDWAERHGAPAEIFQEAR